MISCETCVAGISEYLDQNREGRTLDQGQDWTQGQDAGKRSHDAIEAHLRVCPACAAVAASARQMLQMLGEEQRFAMPEAAQQRLRQRLRERMGEEAPAPEARAAAGRRWWAVGMRPLAWAAAAALLLAAGGVMRWRSVAAVTDSGWLIDAHCYGGFAAHPGEHTRTCLLRCPHAHWGLVDAAGHFVAFDPRGTATAVAAVQASPQADHLWVTVRGTPSKAGLAIEHLDLTQPSAAADRPAAAALLASLH